MEEGKKCDASTSLALSRSSTIQPCSHFHPTTMACFGKAVVIHVVETEELFHFCIENYELRFIAINQAKRSTILRNHMTLLWCLTRYHPRCSLLIILQADSLVTKLP